MKSRHYLVRVLTVFMLMAFAIGTTAWSASAVNLQVGSATGLAGQQVTVPVSVDNNAGIGGAAFTIKFNPGNLTFNGVEATDFFPGTSFTPVPPVPPYTDGVTTTRYQFNQYSVAPDQYVAIAGARVEGDPGPGNNLINLIFTINAGVAPGSYPVAILQTTLNNQNAGYPAAGETVPLLMGALPSSDPNFTNLSLAFYPIIDVTPSNGLVTVIEEDVVISGKPDSLINSTSATFTFSSSLPVLKYMCILDNNAAVECISPVDYSGLAEGQHTFTVYSVDPDGNPRSTSAVYIWFIDLTLPDTVLDTFPPTQTIDYIASFTFHSSTDPGPHAAFECKLDNENFTACTSPAEYTNLSNADHTFSVRAIDLAGNVDDSPATYTWHAGPEMNVEGNWIMSFSMVRKDVTPVVAETKQASFPVATSGGKTSGSFSLDNKTYSLTIDHANSADWMIYFSLDIAETGKATINMKGRGKGYSQAAQDISGNPVVYTKFKGDISSGTTIDGVFESYINLPQLPGDTPLYVNLNMVFNRSDCDTAYANQNGPGLLNTTYKFTVNEVDNTFTGSDFYGTAPAISGSVTTDNLIQITSGSNSIAGVVEGLDISGVFAGHDNTTLCNTLGRFTGAGTPSPVAALEMASPAPELLTGQEFSVPVNVDTGTAKLGSFDLKLTWSPASVLSLTSITGQLIKTTNTSIPGEAIFLGWTDNPDTAPTGVTTLGKVSGKATGTPGSNVAINLIKTTLVDPDSIPIPIADTNVLGGDLSIDKAKVYLGEVDGYYSQGTGSTFDVPVIVANAGNRVIGSYDFIVNYDPAILNVLEVLGGDTTQFSAAPVTNLPEGGTSGTLTLNAFQASTTEPVGAAKVAKIKFKVLDAASDRSVAFLTLSIVKLFDANSINLGADAIGNVVTVSAGICGDVNYYITQLSTNKGIDIGDAMFIAQNRAGKRHFDIYPSLWHYANTNGNEYNPDPRFPKNYEIDIGDAMFIAQHRAGKRPVLYCGPVNVTPY